MRENAENGDRQQRYPDHGDKDTGVAANTSILATQDESSCLVRDVLHELVVMTLPLFLYELM